MNLCLVFVRKPGRIVGPLRVTRASGAMMAFIPLRSSIFVLGFFTLAAQAGAQAPTLDTSVPGLAGSSSSALGPAPGAGGGSLGNLPGAGGLLGGRAGPFAPKGVPTSVSTPGSGMGPTELQMPVSAPQPQPVSPTSTPFFGTLEIPSQDDDGPPEGITLDRAIDITLERSLDLRQKYYEIPMARADILQANLRSNPIFYQDGQLLQYRGSSTQFTRAAPGGPSQYDTNISYPLDISHKRQARTTVASRAREFWRRVTRTPSATGSTTSTPPTRPLWAPARPFGTQTRA